MQSEWRHLVGAAKKNQEQPTQGAAGGGTL